MGTKSMVEVIQLRPYLILLKAGLQMIVSVEGIPAEVVDAAVSVKFENVNDCLKRIEAIAKISLEPAFKVLAASYKRIRNIIKENRQTAVSSDLFEHKAEEKLYVLFQK